MIVVLKDFIKTNKSLYNMIRKAQKNGKLPEHYVNGYVAYDTDEYEEYKNNVVMGRPITRNTKPLTRFQLRKFINGELYNTIKKLNDFVDISYDEVQVIVFYKGKETSVDMDCTKSKYEIAYDVITYVANLISEENDNE